MMDCTLGVSFLSCCGTWRTADSSTQDKGFLSTTRQADTAAMSEEENRTKETITLEAWNLIRDYAVRDSIDEDKMTEIANQLGYAIRSPAIGGDHLRRKKEGKGKGAPGMRAVLVDWWNQGNLADLNTIQALDVLINIFEDRSISLNPLVKELKRIKEAQQKEASADSNNGHQTLPVATSVSGTHATPKDPDTKNDGSCLGRMKPSEASDNEFYNMDHKFRGKAIIFNNVEFSDDLDLTDREGSQKDADDLEKVLKGLGFDVDKFLDLTSKLIGEKLENVAKDKKRRNADSDCVLVVVLSHGDGDDNIAAQDGWYEDEILWKPFLAEACPSLG